MLFINDIQDSIKSTVRLFADDCLLYNTITNQADENTLQTDLDKLINWADTWGMRFNASKCNIMRVTNKHKLASPNYNIAGSKLETTNECKYLGIIIQNNLKWNQQTQHATNKASKTLGFIKRNFHYASKNTKEKLYHTIVRPHLEYGVAAWDPHTTKNINNMEKIQRRAARFVVGDYSRESSVSQMITSLGWDSLQDRRRAHRLTCLYKITNDLLEISKDYTKPKTDRNRRGHDQQFTLFNTRLAPFANSFFPKTIAEWNILPQTTISQTTKEAFKSSLLRN